MSIHELDWPHLTQQIAAHTKSQKARDLCRHLGPLPKAAQATTQAQNVIWALPLLNESFLPDFSASDVVPQLLERLRVQAVLDPRELVDLRRFLVSALQMKELLRLAKNAWTDKQNSGLADFTSQISAIDHVVALDGSINETASGTLKSLCDEKRSLQREITRLMDDIVARRHMEPSLQDKYVTSREGRMVIPIKSGSQHDVKGLIHDASQSKQTVFIEPEEVVPLNNRLREVQINIEEEIHRILAEISAYLARSQTAIQNAENALVECDATLAKAQIQKQLKGTVAEFSQGPAMKLVDLRHPLLVLQGRPVVGNTVALDGKKRILLLSGPNAGGKTVLLKAIGLAAVMARAGLPIPCTEGSHMPFFDHVDPIVGDLQSVGENLSSFSSHIKRLTAAVDHHGLKTLILVDEICGSTDPEEGAALARSFIDEFAESEVFAVITSHLGPLKERWSESSPLIHGSLEFDNKTHMPTYQLLMGFPGQSLGLQLAMRLGVPSHIVERAHSYLSPQSQVRSQELQEIETVKGQLLELRQQAQKDRAEAQSQKEQYLELVRKFREQRDRWFEKAIAKAQKQIDQLIDAGREARLKNMSLHELKADLPEIVKAKPAHRVQTIEEFKQAFPPGTPAFLSRLGRQVLIQGTPDSRGQVTVLSESMRLQVPWYSLSSMESKSAGDTGSASKPTVIKRRPAGSAAAASAGAAAEDKAPELDLRGRRVDEALDLLETFLDRSLLQQVDRVRIVHGFGTEQLKKAIRQFLSKSRYISRWTPGTAESGGDGVTWATLSDD